MRTQTTTVLDQSMSNTKLIFNHAIPIEVFTEADAATVKLLINGEICFEKEYNGNTVHRELIQFDREYEDSSKTKMSFLFSGTREVENKHIKILQLSINKQSVNIYNAEYFPEIDTGWWQSLNTEEKEKQNTVIHGKANNTFGWYGEINYYYCCGFDMRSRFNYNKKDQDPEILLHRKRQWIFLDKDSVKGHEKIK